MKIYITANLLFKCLKAVPKSETACPETLRSFQVCKSDSEHTCEKRAENSDRYLHIWTRRSTLRDYQQRRNSEKRNINWLRRGAVKGELVSGESSDRTDQWGQFKFKLRWMEKTLSVKDRTGEIEKRIRKKVQRTESIASPFPVDARNLLFVTNWTNLRERSLST